MQKLRNKFFLFPRDLLHRRVNLRNEVHVILLYTITGGKGSSPGLSILLEGERERERERIRFYFVFDLAYNFYEVWTRKGDPLK